MWSKQHLGLNLWCAEGRKKKKEYVWSYEGPGSPLRC